MFTIESSSGVLRLGETLDAETSNIAYTLVISATDGINTKATDDIIITIDDVNEFAHAFPDLVLNVPVVEDSAGTTIATLGVLTDQDITPTTSMIIIIYFRGISDFLYDEKTLRLQKLDRS